MSVKHRILVEVVVPQMGNEQRSRAECLAAIEYLIRKGKEFAQAQYDAEDAGVFLDEAAHLGRQAEFVVEPAVTPDPAAAFEKAWAEHPLAQRANPDGSLPLLVLSYQDVARQVWDRGLPLLEVQEGSKHG